jgi:hypothetical protein
VESSPMTSMFDDRSYVAVASGPNIVTFRLSDDQ